MLTIVVANQIAGQEGYVFLDAMMGDADALTSRVSNFGAGTSGFGLVTAFSGPSSVPDGGSTILLLGFGFICLGLFAFKQKRQKG